MTMKLNLGLVVLDHQLAFKTGVYMIYRKMGAAFFFDVLRHVSIACCGAFFCGAYYEFKERILS